MLGAILALHQYVFVAWCLVKHRVKFTLPCLPHYLTLINNLISGA